MRNFVCSALALLASSVSAAVGAAPLTVTLTFDDGVKGHLLYAAPMLEKYGWRGTFNIVTDWIGQDKKLSWDEVRELRRRGHEIANHTKTHPFIRDWYAWGRTNDLVREFAVASDVLKREVGVAPRYLCHPYVHVNAGIDALIRAQGMEPYTGDRFNVGGDVPPAALARTLDGWIADGVRSKDILFHGITAATGGWKPFASEREFEGCLSEIRRREQAGLLRVVPYGEYLKMARPAARLEKVAGELCADLVMIGATTVVDAALKAVAEADRAADARWCACGSLEELRKLQAETRAKVVESMGALPERCALDARTVGCVRRDGYSIEKVLFASEPNHHVTAHLFLPDAAKFPGRRPGLVIPCGHSLNGKAEPSYQRGGLMAAKRGFVALIYDPLEQGERRQNRRNDGIWTTRAHNEIGRRAELLGWSMARFRLRDGVRALDYLATRPEVDPGRLGVMGHSGGGTMTSWIMALDERVRCAAPSGYLSTLHDVCDAIGPQDAEQFVFGELAYGFNHLGHVLLRAPSPVLMCASEEDFFPIRGARATAGLAADVYFRIGATDAFRFSHVMGPHHWHESTRAFAVDWMDWKLQKGAPPKTMQDYRRLDVGFSESAVDTALSDAPGGLRQMRAKTWPASVTPTGSTLDLPGERTVYDQMRDEAARQKAVRKPLTPETVRRVAGIRGQKDIRAEARDGKVLVMDDGTPVPVRVAGAGETVLYVADGGEAPSFKDCRVVTADIRGFGATGGLKHEYYGVREGDEELAVLYHLLGRKLVGKRAEDIIAAAKFAGGRVKLVAKGRAAIPAAHAYYTAREIFSGIELVDPPPSWAEYLAGDGRAGRFADIVRGAWAHYDWTDLAARRMSPRTGN